MQQMPQPPQMPPGGVLGGVGANGVPDVLCLTGSDHGRARWTAHEDDVIQEGVERWGCKWRQIAALLPGRSDSSIRNRWMRLLKAGSEEGAPPNEAASTGNEAGSRPRAALPSGTEGGAREAAAAEQERNGVTDDALILLGFASQKAVVGV